MRVGIVLNAAFNDDRKMDVCASNPLLGILSAVFAAAAAALWLWSAVTKTPDTLPKGPQKNLFLIFDDIHESLRTQSRRSAWAAIAASLSAILQVASFFAPICLRAPFG